MIKYDEMLDILFNMDIKYKLMNSKGLIDYNTDTIYLNPLVNEDVQTLYHELLHFKSDMIDETYLPETEIEKLTHEGFKQDKGLEKFLSDYLKRYAYEKDTGIEE